MILDNHILLCSVYAGISLQKLQSNVSFVLLLQHNRDSWSTIWLESLWPDWTTYWCQNWSGYMHYIFKNVYALLPVLIFFHSGANAGRIKGVIMLLPPPISLLVTRRLSTCQVNFPLSFVAGLLNRTVLVLRCATAAAGKVTHVKHSDRGYVVNNSNAYFMHCLLIYITIVLFHICKISSKY